MSPRDESDSEKGIDNQPVNGVRYDLFLTADQHGVASTYEGDAHLQQRSIRIRVAVDKDGQAEGRLLEDEESPEPFVETLLADAESFVRAAVRAARKEGRRAPRRVQRWRDRRPHH